MACSLWQIVQVIDQDPQSPVVPAIEPEYEAVQLVERRLVLLQRMGPRHLELTIR
jgi:hypothetical protein